MAFFFFILVCSCFWCFVCLLASFPDCLFYKERKIKSLELGEWKCGENLGEVGGGQIVIIYIT